MSAPLVPSVEFLAVAKSYGDKAILRDVTLSVAAGDFMVIYGAPASGKSVLMRLLTGLEAPTAGRIMLRGADVTGVPPSDRNIGYVPQSFALYPHISVYDNIAYPLKLAGVKRSESEPVVRQVAQMLKIEDLLGKRPDQLSGGQKQRVAIARGIAKQSEIYVLDDPLTGLDFKLREQLVDDLKQLQETWRATFLYTTSDPIEALTLADHVAILAGGRVVEAGEPGALYRDPGHAETMGMLGFPRANFLDGALARRDGRLWCRTSLFEFPVTETRDGNGATDVTVGIRPENIHLEPRSPSPVTHHPSPGVWLDASVLLREDLGGEEIVYLDVNGVPLTTVVRHGAGAAVADAAAAIALAPHDLVVFAPAGEQIGRGAPLSHG